ncbi:MAG: methyltransferase regulatory domain-containing protein [Planctomycetota bacterium]|jgi:methyltransferase-like protein/trans-aconitate methyltransferase
MSEEPHCNYDEVPYPKTTHRDSHVRRLESLATLVGMKPAAIDSCRVLELGCASGWNLISQAREFPDSEFVGIDASAAQIEEGKLAVAATGLANIDLSHGDIMAIDSALGRFDYIICHGVYSWVPDHVQAKILDVCRENLSPSGVALVSYNVYPGWHFRGLVRNMMLFHTRGYKDSRERIGQAKAALDFMAAHTDADTPYGKMLADEMDLIRSAGDSYLFHDHLEPNNKPLYFHEFIARAQEKGLQYLSDSNFSQMLPHRLPEGARQALSSAPMVQMEQYLDFLRNTSFRNTLLCHADVPLQRQIKPQILNHFQLTLAQKPTGFDLDPTSTATVKLSFGNGSFRTNSPLVKAAFLKLESSWPHALSPDELYRRSQKLLADKVLPGNVQETQTRQVLAVALLQTVLSGFTVAHVHPPRLCTSIADKPTADAFVRMQARSGLKVTNLCHEIVALSELAREILVDLDGDHSIEALAETLMEGIRRGDLNFSADGEPVTSPTPELLGALVDHGLQQIREAMLLT